MEKLFTDFLTFDGITLKIIADAEALRSVLFVNEIENEAQNPEFIPQIILDTKRQLLEYLEGNRQVFDLKLNLMGTDFQKEVWQLLLTIPYGKTFSYQEMAHKLGNPKVIRAAASANGKNPIAVIVPCHRVIGLNGDLTGYAGGINNKKWLLNLENKTKNGVLELF